jgi:hypothetical protein
VLKHGLIVEQGSHDQLLAMEHGHYRGLWEKQNSEDQQAEEKKRQALREAEEL